MQSVYDEFDLQCRKSSLSEVFKKKSKEVYFYMRKIFQENKVKFTGYGDDYNGEYEIRFSIH